MKFFASFRGKKFRQSAKKNADPKIPRRKFLCTMIFFCIVRGKILSDKTKKRRTENSAKKFFVHDDFFFCNEIFCIVRGKKIRQQKQKKRRHENSAGEIPNRRRNLKNQRNR
jgi:hypothetical protein